MKICFIMGTDSKFLGGVSVYLKNLIKKIPGNHEIFWIHRGNKNRKYKKKQVNYIEIKVPKTYFLEDIVFNRKVGDFLKNHYFDVVNSHAEWGFWINFYKKKKSQKIIHTYHGSTYHYFKIQLKRFGFIKKVLYSPILLFAYFMDGPPMKKADNIICVSDHVKKELIELHGKREKIDVIRTGVNLSKFKPRNKIDSRKKLSLDENYFYGLYVARGGYWNKGLDRAIKLSEEIYKLDKNYRLLVVGSDLKKIKPLLNQDFMISFPPQSREKLPYYYNSADIFFNMSRYEGGAPTLVTSEAMSSGCLVVCSKDSNQEIIEGGKNGLIVEKWGKKEAKKILNNKNNKKILLNSMKTIKEISLEKWRKKYLNKLLKSN